MPGQYLDFHALTFNRHEPVVTGKMLPRIFVENIAPEINEVDIYKTAAAAIIAVAFGEAVGRAVAGEYIHAINLESQRGGSRPNEATHPTVADGHAFLTSTDWSVVFKVCTRDKIPEIHFYQAVVLTSNRA